MVQDFREQTVHKVHIVPECAEDDNTLYQNVLRIIILCTRGWVRLMGQDFVEDKQFTRYTLYQYVLRIIILCTRELMRLMVQDFVEDKQFKGTHCTRMC